MYIQPYMIMCYVAIWQCTYDIDKTYHIELSYIHTHVHMQFSLWTSTFTLSCVLISGYAFLVTWFNFLSGSNLLLGCLCCVLGWRPRWWDAPGLHRRESRSVNLRWPFLLLTPQTPLPPSLMKSIHAIVHHALRHTYRISLYGATYTCTYNIDKINVHVFYI